jgi:hypothetical protein
MSETLSLRPGDAIKPDGFVDFYELIALPQSSDDDDIRERINALYSEAQANRDHRNLNKRRDFELLLELLPFARTVLLDPSKRGRYDSYANDARAGLAAVDFETFMNTLTGKADSDAEERASLLGIAENGTRNDNAAAPSRPAKAAASTPSSGQIAPSAQAGLMGSALSVIVFFVGLAIGFFAGQLPIGILIGAIGGAVTWFVTHKKASKIAS